MATYGFHIDWNNDGDFADAGEDISAYVAEAEWQIGYADAGDRAAAPGWLKLTVDNGDGRFSPGNALYGDMLPMRAARVQAVQSGTTYTLFTGCLWRVEPEAGERGARRAVLHCVDRVALLDRYPLEMALMEDKRADEIIAAILDHVVWPPPLSRRWALGIAGHSELGQTTRLGGDGVPQSLETGNATFAHAGDRWFPERTTALAAVREVCASEYGRFHFTRGGTARFLDRHWEQGLHSAAAALGAADAAEVAYRYGADRLYNEVVVRMDPRVEGSAGSVLWQHRGRAVRLPANSTRTIRAVFVNDEGNRHGAAEVIAPAPGVDFTVNENAEGTGASRTDDSRLQVRVEVQATGAALTFQWGLVDGSGAAVDRPVYITAVQLRGTPLLAVDPEAIAGSDALSITRYQRRRLTLEAPLLNDVVTGRAMAHYVCALHKDPVDRVARLTVDGSAHLARTLFDVVCFGEGQTALSAEEGFIVAEHHRVTAADRRHVCTWRLQPLPALRPWLLGDGSDATAAVNDRAKLGQTTWLGF